MMDAKTLVLIACVGCNEGLFISSNRFVRTTFGSLDTGQELVKPFEPHLLSSLRVGNGKKGPLQKDQRETNRQTQGWHCLTCQEWKGFRIQGEDLQK